MIPDEAGPPFSELEVEQSRESAQRLLHTLAQKLQASGAIRHAATGVQRAAYYVQAHSVKDMAIGIGRFARRRPGPTLAVAVAAGLLVGWTLRAPRRQSR